MNALLPFAARVLISAIFVQGALGKIFGWSSGRWTLGATPHL